MPKKQFLVAVPQTREEMKASHRLVTDCNIFHGVMFALSVLCVILVCLVFGYLAATNRVEKSVAGRWVASTCAIWAVLLTLYLVYLHVIYYKNNLEQRCIVRILVMVIVYAIDSFAALLWHEEAVWIDVIRDTYEAYVIFTFFSLMMQYLGGANNIVKKYWDNGTKTIDHPFPLCCLKPVTLDRKTLLFWEVCVLQYAIINPLLSVTTLLIFFLSDGLYAEGSVTDYTNSYPWIAGMRFISVTFAFTALVYFFIATNEHMKEKRPLGKFVSIKIIVFFSFWQSVTLSGLSHFEIIKPTQFWSSDSIATGASNFLLCVEMWLIAVAHKWVFSHEPYAAVPDEAISWVPKWPVIYDIFFCSDAFEQLQNVFGGVKQHVVGDGGSPTQTIDDEENTSSQKKQGVEIQTQTTTRLFRNDDEKGAESASTTADPPSAAAVRPPSAVAVMQQQYQEVEIARNEQQQQQQQKRSPRSAGHGSEQTDSLLENDEHQPQNQEGAKHPDEEVEEYFACEPKKEKKAKKEKKSKKSKLDDDDNEEYEAPEVVSGNDGNAEDEQQQDEEYDEEELERLRKEKKEKKEKRRKEKEQLQQEVEPAAQHGETKNLTLEESEEIDL